MEIGSLGILSFLIWVASNLWLFAPISSQTKKLESLVGLGIVITSGLIIGLAALLAFVILGMFQSQSNSEIIFFPASILIFAFQVCPPMWLAFIGLWLSLWKLWINLSNLAPNSIAATQAESQIAKLALGLLLLGWLPFVLWAFGVIPLYEMALALAAALIMILLWRTWPKIVSLRQQALTPPAV